MPEVQTVDQPAVRIPKWMSSYHGWSVDYRPGHETDWSHVYRVKLVVAGMKPKSRELTSLHGYGDSVEEAIADLIEQIPVGKHLKEKLQADLEASQLP